MMFEEKERVPAEFKKRLDEIEIQLKPLYDEQYSINQEIEKLTNAEVKRLAVSVKWVLVYSNDDFDRVYIEPDLDWDERKAFRKKIEVYLRGYHESFELVEELEYPERVKLSYNDGEIVIVFYSIQTYLKYQSLFDIDNTNVKNIIDKKRQEVEQLSLLLGED